MTKAQLRAARALLSWSQDRLSDASGVSLATIKRLEPGDGLLATKLETADKLRRALEAAGVEFTNGGQPGVKLVATSLPKLPRRKSDREVRLRLKRGGSDAD